MMNTSIKNKSKKLKKFYKKFFIYFIKIFHNIYLCFLLLIISYNFNICYYNIKNKIKLNKNYIINLNYIYINII